MYGILNPLNINLITLQNLLLSSMCPYSGILTNPEWSKGTLMWELDSSFYWLVNRIAV